MVLAAMFRLVVYLFLTILLISVVRAILRTVLQGFASLFQTSQQTPVRQAQRPNDVPLTGELKRDPVCGTYTVASNAIRQDVNGQTLYFCSNRCRDEYMSAARR